MLVVGGGGLSYERGTSAGKMRKRGVDPLGPLGFEGAQHRQTLRPSVDGVRSKARWMQWHLAQNKSPSPLEPPQAPMHRPTVGS
jgi:hypothetical protein